MAHSENVSAVLVELEAVLRDEHDALRKLDHERIARASEQKLELDLRMKTELATSPPKRADMAALERIRRAALENQLLIVHARACVQSILSMVAGDDFTTYPGATPRRVAPSPLRVDMRG